MSAHDDEFPTNAFTAIGIATSRSTCAAESAFLASTAATDSITNLGMLDVDAVAGAQNRTGRRRAIQLLEFPNVVIDIASADFALLERLTSAGIYGASPDDVATYLICRGLDDLVRAGVLKLDRPE